ncbi:MAG: hypothetical protein FWC45_08105 [Treponema sp.]|nr:hypothetical protein [Treponema sp.]
MASSALNVLSGIAAAAAGLAGEKVPNTGSIPGLDLAEIIPALLGKTGAGGGIAGTLMSVVAKTGLLGGSKLGNLAELAGSLLSFSNPAGTEKKAAGGIAGLAAAVIGNTGSGANLGSIAALASKLGNTAGNDKDLTSMASNLGKTLSDSFGISLNGSGTALKALDKVLGDDTKSALFKTILKGLV